MPVLLEAMDTPLRRDLQQLMTLAKSSNELSSRVLRPMGALLNSPCAMDRPRLVASKLDVLLQLLLSATTHSLVNDETYPGRRLLSRRLGTAVLKVRSFRQEVQEAYIIGHILNSHPSAWK
eukprot:TRINITY_DN49442_c0_g1_i1.p2 TRINITY_DN49442_c0_g1~~TRINITY_DN49442_c0_g1_i1.p2  ORF type:complete len:121 (+),score=8.10 TRINITY_DN49442_c0_g1_i1:62-424(+)